MCVGGINERKHNMKVNKKEIRKTEQEYVGEIKVVNEIIRIQLAIPVGIKGLKRFIDVWEKDYSEFSFDNMHTYGMGTLLIYLSKNRNTCEEEDESKKKYDKQRKEGRSM